jgi:DNA-binding response OmpR family regulator
MSQYKILLADDEPQNIKNLFDALNPEIYRVFVASNGKAAVEQAIKHRPDAIIMDWDMPEMNGIEAIRLIRATDEIKEIPIIVATGKMTHVENLRTALETGANDYIRKPYDPIEIEARVNSMIRLNLDQQKIIRLQNKLYQEKLDKAKYEMEISQQALTASKLRLIYNSKTYETLLKELQSLEMMVDKEAQFVLKKITSGIMSSTTAINWKEFELHFEKVHPDFFSSLRSSFPDLTTNETELCAFIKMNMNVKEIIAITYKNDNTLKKAKQRLKKKLELLEDESLYSFIQEFK